MTMEYDDVDSIDFTGESGADCYRKFYQWDSDRVYKEKKRKTHIIDKQLCYDGTTCHGFQYRLIVVYFRS
jgi:hypothetical protein